MKETLVVNMLGGPGVGKSTMMAAVFALLKQDGVDCEIVTEFAKDLVWDERHETFKDEIYIFAKQEHRLFRVNGKVDVIITDRPLILTCFYGQANKELSDLCLSEFNKYNNMNFLVERAKSYNPNGRNQTEDEAKEIDAEFKAILKKLDIPFHPIVSDAESIILVYKAVKNYLETVDAGK